MPEDALLDDVARHLRAELIEIAVDQISRPIAHEFDIRIDLREGPEGTAVVVEASSRSVQRATTEVRVSVRPAEADDLADLVVERDGGHRLDVALADAHPEISAALHHRLSDFVAGCIAAALARLNAEMQRHLGWRD
ncbi:MAG: hypothetical protein ACR2FE_01150 [Aeromicrobium sp.]